jgi:hypothetical protein
MYNNDDTYIDDDGYPAGYFEQEEEVMIFLFPVPLAEEGMVFESATADSMGSCRNGKTVSEWRYCSNTLAAAIKNNSYPSKIHTPRRLETPGRCTPATTRRGR